MSASNNYIKFCSEPLDLYGEPLPAFRSTIMFVLLNESSKLITIECHNIDTIKETIKSSEVYQDYPKKTEKLFKLPLSGLWCQVTVFNTSNFNTFIVDSIGKKKIGSEFGVSRLHGAEEIVYRLIPFNRKVLIQILNKKEDERYDALNRELANLFYVPMRGDYIELDEKYNYAKKDVLDESEDGAYGIIYYASGNKYKGNLKNNVPEGEGNMKYADGKSYEGDWKSGKRDGEGSLKNGKIILYTGKWKNDNPVGEIKHEEIVNFSAGSSHVLILKNNGNVYACGDNQFGQLGLKIVDDYKDKFIKVDIKDVKDVFCGDHHTMILKNDGTLWACGNNDSGQLGLELDDDYKNEFIKVDIKDVKDVSCGSNHTMILKTDGTLWACGNNSNGELGLGNKDNTNKFIKVDIKDVKNVVCSVHYTIILKTDGTLWGCGSNRSNRMGFEERYLEDINKFTKVEIENVKKVSCKDDFMMIILDDGHLLITGQFLGSIYNMVDIYQNVDEVTCGLDHAMIITNDGTLLSEGENEYGQTGLGNKTKYKKFKEIGKDVQKVICSDYYSVLLKKDKTLWTCGANYFGQLGLGDTENRNKFTMVNI